VEIVNIAPKGSAGTETLAGRNTPRYDTLVKVAGDYGAMNSFLRYLEEGPYLSLRIENAAFTRNRWHVYRGNSDAVVAGAAESDLPVICDPPVADASGPPQADNDIKNNVKRLKGGQKWDFSMAVAMAFTKLKACL